MKEVQKIIKEKSAGQGMDVTQADFLESVRKVSHSVNEEDLKRYEKCESVGELQIVSARSTHPPYGRGAWASNTN